MSLLIKGSLVTGGELVEDTWSFVGSQDELDGCGDASAVAMPLGMLGSASSQKFGRVARLGAILAAGDDALILAPWIDRLELVAINFPAFTDGRGYSSARLLRERLGYRGELRAIGDVLRDQVFYLLRCGFDSLAPRADQNVEQMLGAFRDFSQTYQSAVDQPLPLFARPEIVLEPSA